MHLKNTLITLPMSSREKCLPSWFQAAKKGQLLTIPLNKCYQSPLNLWSIIILMNLQFNRKANPEIVKSIYCADWFICYKKKKLRIFFGVSRAIDGARTRGLDLGKVARYQLRHYRISGWWESNPRIQLGRLVFYHWTTPAHLMCFCVLFLFSRFNTDEYILL